MNKNSEIITILCSHLCVGDDVKPLEPKEWGNLAKLLVAYNLQPGDLLDFSLDDFKQKLNVDEDYATRLLRLIDRSASLAFEVAKYENIGIKIVTRADAEYPQKLKRKLGAACPPLFYYAGNLKLLDVAAVGYVGSRDIDDEATEFTVRTVAKTMAKGYGVVSGGAKGVDVIAENESLMRHSPVVEFLSDSMLRRMRSGAIVRAIQDGNLLLLSAPKPDAGFNAGLAMMRNKYIYAQSEGTIVVKSDYNKGGTWTGAAENLTNGWSKEFCWRNGKYVGNMELIRRGAIPIDDDWNGDVNGDGQELKHYVQASIFDTK
ncbi:MAG: DNA-protecting protein DprA [Clostridiales bacterium]|nr:DNA-protecting protein DprA [Clostridiales bacterium]